MTRLSEKQARELLGDNYSEQPRKNKYCNRKTVVDVKEHIRKEPDH